MAGLTVEGVGVKEGKAGMASSDGGAGFGIPEPQSEAWQGRCSRAAMLVPRAVAEERDIWLTFANASALVSMAWDYLTRYSELDPVEIGFEEFDAEGEDRELAVRRDMAVARAAVRHARADADRAAEGFILRAREHDNERLMR